MQRVRAMVTCSYPSRYALTGGGGCARLVAVSEIDLPLSRCGCSRASATGLDSTAGHRRRRLPTVRRPMGRCWVQRRGLRGFQYATMALWRSSAALIQLKMGSAARGHRAHPRRGHGRDGGGRPGSRPRARELRGDRRLLAKGKRERRLAFSRLGDAKATRRWALAGQRLRWGRTSSRPAVSR